LIGNFKNPGVKWERSSTNVNDHDFRSDAVGIGIPYGIYDPRANRGCVVVGASHETSTFAVSSICKWWKTEGCKYYPQASPILILADTGGSNGSRRSAWKLEPQQQLCDRLGLRRNFGNRLLSCRRRAAWGAGQTIRRPSAGRCCTAPSRRHRCAA
ncbi:MAG: hypothetical protein JJE04_21260, partial [Acidobacteriia bacterium]|nr:hypothetical protein [Terriglobia bacterium]